jgi:hypothetical protein
MSFEGDLLKFAATVEGRIKDTVTEAGLEVHRSLVEGSEVTGAPGQPVDIGTLKGSWIAERTSDLEWQDTTNLEYAPAIEAGVQQPYTTAKGTAVTPGPMTLRSEVGGFHSVALTRAGWPQIVDASVAKVVQ